MVPNPMADSTNVDPVKRILIVSDDKIGRAALTELQHVPVEQIWLDRSSNIHRVFSLLVKRRVPLQTFFKMFVANLLRPSVKLVRDYPVIQNNDDLLQRLEKIGPAELVLFRAGLIVNRHVLGKTVSVVNIHCARLPDFGGLGVIANALKQKEYRQCATLHQVTVRIDEGKVLREWPYELNPEVSYFQNEQTAYAAGIALLKDLMKL